MTREVVLPLASHRLSGTQEPPGITEGPAGEPDLCLPVSLLRQSGILPYLEALAERPASLTSVCYVHLVPDVALSLLWLTMIGAAGFELRRDVPARAFGAVRAATRLIQILCAQFLLLASLVVETWALQDLNPRQLGPKPSTLSRLS